MKSILLFLALALTFATSALAQIIRVPADQPTIQAAINAAAQGDTVLVADGTYYENISFKGKAITVASHYWADRDTNHINNTIINGSKPSHPDSGSVVYFISGEDTTSVLYGFTITGGRGTLTVWVPGYPESAGGGIFVRDAGAKIEKNKIIQNGITVAGDSAFAHAGGVFVVSEAGNYVVIRDNDISYNTVMAPEVTGIAGAAGVFLTTKATCVFEKNRVSHNVCDGNWESLAGGVWIEGYIGEGFEGPYIVRDNIIIGNKQLNGSYINGAGGIFLQGGSPILTNNIISGNFAYDGGGIFINASFGRAMLINNTITNNSATSGGGGILVQYASPIVMNTILWGNSAPADPQIRVSEGQITVRYSDVQGGWSGEGNKNDDPQFADTLFHLANSSPCIGAGTHSYDFGGGTICFCPNADISGNPRPWPANSNPDMGAMESELATEVTSQEPGVIPRAFALQQNFPNPFNPSTKIEFALPKASLVTLKIYDLLGNEVATLVADKLPAGKHERVWEAKGLASGMYVCRIEAGDFVQTKKLMLLR